MELVVLIQEFVKVVRRGAASVPVFFFLHPDLTMVNFTLRKDTSMWCNKELRSTCLMYLLLL